MVKRLLDLKDAKYEAINLDEHPDLEEEARTISGGFSSVPITTNGGSVVVGWSPREILALLA
jgi:glutaredoxin